MKLDRTVFNFKGKRIFLLGIHGITKDNHGYRYACVALKKELGGTCNGYLLRLVLKQDVNKLAGDVIRYITIWGLAYQGPISEKVLRKVTKKALRKEIKAVSL